jgi:hypothetical protein
MTSLHQNTPHTNQLRAMALLSYSQRSPRPLNRTVLLHCANQCSRGHFFKQPTRMR